MRTPDGEVIRVGIVDDHALVADGVRALLSLEPDIQVIGSASSVEAGVDLISRERPDVVVCDVQVGDRSGFSLLDQLQGADGPAFVMFSSYDHPAYHKAAFEGGASGYVLKDGSSDQLIDAVRAAAAGELSFSLRTLRTVRQDVRLPSERELEVIGLVATGRSNDELAAELGIRPKTVESHLRTLFDRYGVMSRTELALHAVQEGWIRRSRRTDDAGHRRAWLTDLETMDATKGRGSVSVPRGRAD
ncbi:MAG: response regulator transcription factor [Dehalococcoidia bacterium]